MESYFHNGVNLTGTLRLRGSMHFEGDFQGEIYSDDHFIVGKNGHIRGKVNVHDFTNMGKVKGNVRAEGKVSLVAGSDLMGDITTSQLIVEDEVNFEGHCKMIHRKGRSKNKTSRSTREIPAKTLETPMAGEPPESHPAEASPASLSIEDSDDAPVPQRRFNISKKIVAVVILILAISVGYYYYPKFINSGLEAHIARGYEYLKQKKYSDAESELQKALSGSRNNPDVYAGLGKIYLKRKKFNEAMAYFQKSIQLNPSESSYHLKLAEAYTAKGNLDEAMKVYKTALELDAQSYEAYYQIGVLRISQGARADGVESLNMSIKLNTDYYKPYKILGELYAGEGENEKALAEFRRAIRLKADDPDLYLVLGELLFKEKKENEAITIFKKLAKTFPQNLKGQVRLADWFFKRGDADRALGFYEKAEFLDPQNYEIQARLGQLYSGKNKFNKAMDAFNKAVELNPQDDNSFYQLGRLLNSIKKYGDARVALESAIGLNKKHADAHIELGKVFLAIGEGKEAVKKMKRAYALKPDSNSSYFLAQAQTEQKMFNQAEKVLFKATKKDPGNHLLRFGLCDTYYYKKLFTAAISHCEKALKLNSGYPDTLSRLAWLYARKNKNLDKGLGYAKKALENDPENTGYLSSLAEVYYSLGEKGLAVVTIESAIELEPEVEIYKKQERKFKSANP